MVRQRVGIIGGGQLAQMMGESADDLGIDLVIQTPYPDDPAVAVAKQVIFAPITDALATAQLAQLSDVITFENEFVDLEALKPLAEQGVIFYPTLANLAPLLDKYEQRQYLASLNLPVPAYFSLEDAIAPAFPLVVKVRRHGYDGQGTFVVHSPAELENIRQQLQGLSLMGEEFIAYDQELAVMAARSHGGEIAIYPVVETQQQNQVCRRVIIPAAIPSKIQTEIEVIARHFLEQLQAVGVFGIEFFLTKDGKILINEIAPRTHNSGHYTLDACLTSQFAMQLRVVTGLPLTAVNLKTPKAVMVNLLGYEYSNEDYAEKREKIAALPLTYVHWYGKGESRPGRKLGHITVLADSQGTGETGRQGDGEMETTLLAKAQLIEDIWYGVF